jgi:ABC-2 type transport system ATP-binding protein
VLTTHYLDEAERLADRVAILRDGRICACGTPTELAKQAGAEPRMALVQPSLEEVYLELVGSAEGIT